MLLPSGLPDAFALRRNLIFIRFEHTMQAENLTRENEWVLPGELHLWYNPLKSLGNENEVSI